MSCKARRCIFLTGLFISLLSPLYPNAAIAKPHGEDTNPIILQENSDGGYVLQAKGVTMEALVERIHEVTDVQIELDDALKQQVVAFDLEAASVEDLIQAVSDSNAMVFERDGDSIRLVSAILTSQQEELPVVDQESTVYPLDLDKFARRHRLTNVDRLESAQAGRSDYRLLSLKNALIDTRAANDGKGLKVPDDLSAREDNQWFIVQFEDKITLANRDALTDGGFTIGHYIPNNALAVKAAPSELDSLRAIAGVYFIEPYHPYFKLSYSVLDFMMDEEGDSNLAQLEYGTFNLISFHGSKNLENLPVEVVKENDLGDRVVVTVTANPKDLRAVAFSDDVQWIEPSIEMKTMNDTGDKKIAGRAFKLKRPEFTGSGVTIGVSDSGVDVKHAAFARNVNFPTDIGINTRIKKYVFGPSITSDGFIGDTDGHGTHVAGSILGNGGPVTPNNGAVSIPGSKGPPYTNTFEFGVENDTAQFGGVAPDAQLVMIEDFNTFSYEFQVEFAYTNAARLANNSWGADFWDYSSDSLAWDTLVRDARSDIAGRQEYAAFFAAGNSGEGETDGLGGTSGTIGTPGNAKNVVTVGAVEQPRRANNLPGALDVSDSDWQVANFSGRGPTPDSVSILPDGTVIPEFLEFPLNPPEPDSEYDHRIKPDVVAPGVYVLSAQSSETMPDLLIDPFGLKWDYRSGNVDSGTNYAFLSGTSMSTPLVTGAGALFFEYYTNTFQVAPSPAMIKAALIGGARNLNTLIYRNAAQALEYGQDVPVYQGWGMVDVLRSVDGTDIGQADEVIFIDQDFPILTGQFFSRQITVNQGDGGLKIALAWSDTPGNPAVARQLVNDLDLTVLAAGGGGYVGNRFGPNGVHSELFQVANSVIYGDRHNNVEVITIPDVIPGTYTIRVFGNDVPEGPQDFALFIMKGIGQEKRDAGSEPSLTVDENSRPYVAFTGPDAASNTQVFVKQWRGDFGDISDLNQWRRLDDNWFGLQKSASDTGVSLSLEDSLDPTIAVRNGEIHVAWIQHGVQTNIFMRKYNGIAWEELGASASGLGVSQQTAYAPQQPQIAIAGDGNPIIAWRQRTLTNYRIVAKKWNGAAWVGIDGSDVAIGDSNQAVNPSLTINSAGNPVVAWEELITQRVHVWQFNGATWVNLGQRGSAPFAGDPDIDAGPNGELYLAYVQTPNGVNSNFYFQIRAERRASGVWSAMGTSTNIPGISEATNTAQRTYNPSIVYSEDPDPRVHVAWQSGTNELNSILVKRYDFSSWQGIGGAGISPGVALTPGVSRNPDLGVTPQGVPVVAYENNGAQEINEIVTYGLIADVVRPEFDGLVLAEGGTSGNVDLAWAPAQDNISKTIVYNIYMGNDTFACYDLATCIQGDVFSNLLTSVTNTTSYEVTGLAAYESRCFAVRAVDEVGNIDTNSIIISASPIEPGVPCFDWDTDLDGLPNWWEQTWFGNETSANPNTTNVVGGISNLASHDNSTDPFKVDSDKDGISDADEIANGTFPSAADTDGDGLDDGVETAIGSDPLNADSNGNGADDGFMVSLGYSDPTVSVDIYTNLLVETFEFDSATRASWKKITPNQAFPLNFWHLSDAVPVAGIPGVVRITDRTTNTSYRMAIDMTPSKNNADATYNAGTNKWVAALQSPSIDATAVSNLFITWKEFRDVEPNKDFVEVQAAAGGGPVTNWVIVDGPRSGTTMDWEIHTANLSQFAGQASVFVRFLFTADSINNGFNGWYIDDFKAFAGYEILNSWVRDVNGCPVTAAKVYAIGVGIITNTIDGHKVVQPGRVIAEVPTAQDGSFSFALPKGTYIFKAEHPSYRAEFWNGQLFTPPYSFGSGLNPGVFKVSDVAGAGILTISDNLNPGIQFELEPGNNAPGLVGVSAPLAENVAADFIHPIGIWNGATNGTAAEVDYTALTTGISTMFNGADWYANPVQPNFISSLADGTHRIGLNTNWNVGTAEVDVRAGEISRTEIAKDAGDGFLFIAAYDGIERDIWINGTKTDATTPALLKMQSGRHLVQIALTNELLGVTRYVDVPLGGRTNIGFTVNSLTAEESDMLIQTIDKYGNEITDASIYISGRLLTTNLINEISRDQTPVTVPGFRVGTHLITYVKPGYQQTVPAAYGILADQTSYALAALINGDIDYDGLGDGDEITSFTNIFAYSGIDDPDADGLLNASEFSFFENFGLVLDPNDPDRDNDQMLDGDEVGFDQLVTVGDHIMYAKTTLSTNAIDGNDSLRLRFVGRYLDGIWNFGNSSVVRVSVDGDIVASTNYVHTFFDVPSLACVETVLTNVPYFVIAESINRGAPVNTRVFADTDPGLKDTDNDIMWDGFENMNQFMTNAFLFIEQILDPIGEGNGDSDPDADGAINKREFLGTNNLDNAVVDWSRANNPDTDGDTMPDGWEYDYGLSPIDPLDANYDPDVDFLINALEYFYGTNPRLFDTDGDTLGDGEEVAFYETDPANPDSDFDHVFDGLELVLGIDPLDWDTDDDGMSDGFELLDANGDLRSPEVRLNPLDASDADNDNDLDGLTNLEEYQVRDGQVGNPPDGVIWDYWTDPFTQDTDADGMPDGWEVYYGLHPVDPVTDTLGNQTTRNELLSRSGDKDGDGLWNLREFEVRFHIDPEADAYAIFGLSTDPNDVDTDDDGLWDGEEDRQYRANPLLQDSDNDAVFDGTAQDDRYGEVESVFRSSAYELVACATCTWNSAEALAQVPHPIFSNVVGQLASIPFDLISGENPELELIMTSILTGTETLVAIGGGDSNGVDNGFFWLDDSYFSDDLLFPYDGLNTDASNFDDSSPYYLALLTNGMWATISPTQEISHYLIEWAEIPQVTNHYDLAMNDLWRLRWPSVSDLPSWERVSVDAASPLPPPRWSSAATYIPVFETKNPRNDIVDGTKILMDNRQFVVFGGTDGVTKHRDVWEYVIRSNMWKRSTAPLNDVPPAFFDGLSGSSAITVFRNKNTGCEDFGDNSQAFAQPNHRPWSDSRSFDWTYLFGGWDKSYTYLETHAFYKSTDDPRPIQESKGIDVGLSETRTITIGTTTITTNLTVEEDIDGGFLIGNGYIFDDFLNFTNSLRPYSAIQFNDFDIKRNCDYIAAAELNLVLDYNDVPADFDIGVYVETKNSINHSDPEYDTDFDTSEPSVRLVSGGFTVFGPATATVPGSIVTNITVDVTALISNLVFNAGNDDDPNWDGTILGFVISNNMPESQSFIRVDRANSSISITYRPSFKIEPYWDFPNILSYVFNTRRLTERKNVAMAYDHDRDRLLQFGGIDGNEVFDETYEGELQWTGGEDPRLVRWVQQVSDSTPPARWGASLVYDEKNTRFVLFGGFDADHQPLNDLWIFNPPEIEGDTDTNVVEEAESTNTLPEVFGWVEVTEFDDPQRPQPRGGASMIYYGGFDYDRAIDDYASAANKQKVVLFGGTDGKTYFNDTWVLDDGSASVPPRWILVNPVGEQSQGPSPRAFANFVYGQNIGSPPDPGGQGTYEETEAIPPASAGALLFGGRRGLILTGEDTDGDLITDGREHAIGGPGAARDPRQNALVSPEFYTVTNMIGTNLVEDVIRMESVPYTIKRIGSKPSSSLFPRGAIANFESLRHDDGIYAIGAGLPWEVHADPFSRVGVSGGEPEPGVDALVPSQTTLWYHRAAYENPNATNDVWELGVPDDTLGGNSAPPYAYSGRWVYGTDLDGRYRNDSVIDLFSPVFDTLVPPIDSVPETTTNVNSYFLLFAEWLDLADANDYVQVDVIRPETGADVLTRVTGTNNSSVVVVGPRNFSSNTTGDWRRVAAPLNIAQNETNLYLRFRLVTDSDKVAGGWYIDDVAIVQGGEVSGVLSNFGPGVTVTLHGGNDGSIYSEGITSENGEFGFGLLPQGNYYLSALGSNSVPFVVGSGMWNNIITLTPGEIAFSLVPSSLMTNMILWETIIGEDYQVQYADSAFGPWVNLGPVVTAATNPESIVDPGPIPGMRFYRVKLLNQP